LYNNVTHNKIKYYEIEIKQLKQKVYPDLGEATLWGYDGMAPGPTFFEEKGTESVVRFINHGKMANSVHLHGSYSVRIYLAILEDSPADAMEARPLRRLGGGYYRSRAVQRLLLSKPPERENALVPRPCN
jgi:hypothetical protein